MIQINTLVNFRSPCTCRPWSPRPSCNNNIHENVFTPLSPRVGSAVTPVPTLVLLTCRIRGHVGCVRAEVREEMGNLCCAPLGPSRRHRDDGTVVCGALCTTRLWVRRAVLVRSRWCGEGTVFIEPLHTFVGSRMIQMFSALTCVCVLFVCVCLCV